jgi:digeranylgeranylglycerophospholipid reductase
MQEIHGAIVFAPNGKSIRIDYKGPEGWIVERKLFDKHLAVLAAKAGARILAKTEAKNFRRKGGRVVVDLYYEGKKSEVSTKIVIAADGVESTVARGLGVNTTNKLVDICSGAQFEMAGVKGLDDVIEFYFGNVIAPAGYIWVFKKGDGVANVGIGVRKPWAKKTALQYLEEWVAREPRLKDASIIEVNSGGVPVGGFLKDAVADNLIIAGDAAHHVNPIHGGGIPESYMAGRLAAETAAEAVKKNDFSKKFLKRYDQRWEKERGSRLKKILKLREVMESLSDDNLNWLADYITSEDLVDFSRGEGSSFMKLAKLLMKKPKLIRLAKKLV